MYRGTRKQTQVSDGSVGGKACFRSHAPTPTSQTDMYSTEREPRGRKPELAPGGRGC